MNTRFFFEPFPVISLKDIILREITLSDSEHYLNYMNRAEMLNSLTKEHIPDTREKAIEELQYWGGLFKNKRSIYWAIALAENNRLIGTAGFNHISFVNSKAEISYDLDPDYWGRGIMLKSIKNIIRFIENLGVVRIQATVTVDNINSIKLLERCDFAQEGCMKKFEIVNGVYKDYYMYARIIS